MEAYEPDEVDADAVVDDISDDEDVDKEYGDSSSSSSRPIVVGDVVEVLGGDRPYAGVVIGMIDETTCRLKYFEFEAEVRLPLDSLTRLMFTGPSSVTNPEDIQLNTKGIYQCKYATDQQYYDAIVTALTTYGAQVTYNAYGNSEEVPLAYLKTLEKTKSKKETSALDKSLVPLVIPENLKILPTDTEEVTNILIHVETPNFLLTSLQLHLSLVVPRLSCHAVVAIRKN